jgi:hypothetical protein
MSRIAALFITVSIVSLLAGTTRVQDRIQPHVSFSGANSRIDRPTFERITEPAAFGSLYMRHLGKPAEDFDEFYNPHGVPVVNFRQCMVIAVFAGERTNCAGMYVEAILDQEDQVVVRVVGRYYQTGSTEPNGDGGARKATPFGIFVLPRTDKPVVIEEGHMHLKTDPYTWKEVARFESLKPR